MVLGRAAAEVGGEDATNSLHARVVESNSADDAGRSDVEGLARVSEERRSRAAFVLRANTSTSEYFYVIARALMSRARDGYY